MCSKNPFERCCWTSAYQTNRHETSGKLRRFGNTRWQRVAKQTESRRLTKQEIPVNRKILTIPLSPRCLIVPNGLRFCFIHNDNCLSSLRRRTTSSAASSSIQFGLGQMYYPTDKNMEHKIDDWSLDRHLFVSSLQSQANKVNDYSRALLYYRRHGDAKQCKRTFHPILPE
jgi:hypothetical protein